MDDHRVRPMRLFIMYLNVATVNLYQKIIYKFKMLSSHSKHGMSSSMCMYALLTGGPESPGDPGGPAVPFSP